MKLPGSGDTELRSEGKETIPLEDVEETEETREITEEKEQLDRATFASAESVELKGDIKEAEDIQKTFEVVVESTPVKIVTETEISEFPTDIDAQEESGGSEDASLDIDAVPLPEEPLAAEASTDTEDGGDVMIGTWPTPEAPSKMETGDPAGESGGIDDDSIDMDSDDGDSPESVGTPKKAPPPETDGSSTKENNDPLPREDPEDPLIYESDDPLINPNADGTYGEADPTDEYKDSGTLVDPDGNVVGLPGHPEQADGTRDQEEDSMTPEEAARQAVEEAEEAARDAERAASAAATAEEAYKEALDWVSEAPIRGMGVGEVNILNLRMTAEKAASDAEEARANADDAEAAAEAAVADALGEEPPVPRGSFLIAEDEADVEPEGDLAAPFIPGGSVLSAATSDGNGSEDSDDE